VTDPAAAVPVRLGSGLQTLSAASTDGVDLKTIIFRASSASR